MRKWKQVSAWALTAALTVSGPGLTVWAGPSFARTEEEWARLKDNVMEYEELAGLIHEYNATVKKNQLDISDKKKDDLITRDQYAQNYRDAASDYRSSINGESAIADAQNANSAAEADKLADNAVEDLTIYQMTYEQEEANLVASAQSLMISYFNQAYELESAQMNLPLLQELYNSAVVKKSAGLVTEIDVLTAQENIQNAQVSIDKLKASIEETRQKLCVMLGWNYNDMPEIQEIPALDMERLSSINPETDKAAALENNYTLKINKRKLENSRADFTKQSLNRTIASNEQNINKELVKNYQAVLQAKAAYEQALADYTLESKNMTSAEAKFQSGLISRLDYMKQKNTYDTKSIAIKTAELALFQTVQTYDNAVNGLASAGG